MADAVTKPSVKTEKKPCTPTPAAWQPFETLRHELDRMFESFHKTSGVSPFGRGSLEIEPFWRCGTSWGAVPAVDIVEKDGSYEVSAELPGMDEKDVELELADGLLTIKGEKQEDRGEKRKDYHLSERRYGSFHRSIRLPDAIDGHKIEISFRKGILVVTVPKSPGAQKKKGTIATRAR